VIYYRGFRQAEAVHTVLVSVIWRITIVSDQDFFFEEDEQPKAAKKSDTPKKGGSARPAQAEVAAAPAQGVTMTVAALIGVIALLLGAIGGIFIGRGMAAPTVATTPAVTAPAAGAGGSTTAPQLTEDQMQGGELPAGHPDIGSMGGGAAGGSTETTAK